MNKGKKIPKVIWTLWYQGLEESPMIVSRCVESWIEKNPGWKVVVLTSENIVEYIDSSSEFESLSGLSLVEQSHFVRLTLLAEYGGVWVDATTFCMRSLDDWIGDYLESGFFAFSKPGKDRLLSSWFIACEKGCAIIPKWKKIHVEFFSENKFDITGEVQKKQILALSETFNQNEITPSNWFSHVVTDVLKIYPYFIFHYMFQRLVSGDEECRNIWEQTVKVSADKPHRLQSFGMLSKLDNDIKAEIDEKRFPIYKLTWKYDQKRYLPDTLLYYLFEGEVKQKKSSFFSQLLFWR